MQKLTMTIAIVLMLGMATLVTARNIPCATEDSTMCFWNAKTRGNGQGHSFVSIPVPFLGDIIIQEK